MGKIAEKVAKIDKKKRKSRQYILQYRVCINTLYEYVLYAAQYSTNFLETP